MAETVQTSFAAPVFKRPRLEKCHNFQVSSDPFENKEHCHHLQPDGGSKSAPYEVSSSSDPSSDIYGGDSGFHDLTPPSSAGCIDSTSIDYRTPNHLHNKDLVHAVAGNFFRDPRNEADSSEVIGYNDLSTHSFENKPCMDDDADEVASTISDLSGLSDLSDLSGQEWKPVSGPVSWVQRQMNLGADPRAIIMELVPKDTIIPPHLDKVMLWKIIVNMLSEPPRRTKLAHVNTLEDVVHLLQTCKNIMVLTGAGVSVSCGIPDFRSRNGIYARLSKDYPDLPDPQSMFDIHYFKKDPRPFFKFAKEIYPGQFQPSPSHKFIKIIEQHGNLLRNYTQNIDTLEQAAGIQKVITCHGSFATATCTVCRHRVGSQVIRDDIFNQRIPYCPLCPCDGKEPGIMKPDIVFFGEGLSDEFHDTMAKDKDQCDLLIVMGSSLKVRPVALIPSSIPPDVPQILINREPLKHVTFDVELLGDCDVIVRDLCRRLGNDWYSDSDEQPVLEEIIDLPPVNNRLQCHSDSDITSSTPSNSEVNNNTHSNLVDTTSLLSKPDSRTSHEISCAEESNSCDNRMSACNLEDNQNDNKTNDPDSTSKDFEPTSTLDVEHEKAYWQPRQKVLVTSRLPNNTFLFMSPNRYVFQGAEVYADSDNESGSHNSDTRSSHDSDSSSCSSDIEDDAVTVETVCNDEVSQSLVDGESHTEQNPEISKLGFVFENTLTENGSNSYSRYGSDARNYSNSNCS